MNGYSEPRGVYNPISPSGSRPVVGNGHAASGNTVGPPVDGARGPFLHETLSEDHAYD